MKEGPITDPEQQKELEGYLERSLNNYRNLHGAMRKAMDQALSAGDQAEADRQALRSDEWLRQVKATEATLETLRSTGTYRIRQAAEPEFAVTT